MTEPIRYTVRMTRPHSHRFEVTAHFPAADPSLVVTQPVWSPGSYLVREFSRHVQDVRAEDGEGRALPLTRIDKRSFRIETGGHAVQLSYSVYANELTVRTSHLDDSHGFFNGANLFLYDEARRSEPHHVRIEAPSGWRTFTALARHGEEWVAADYDELVDSPFEVGPHSPLTFEACGIPHEVVLWGDPAVDRERLLADMRRIVETEAALFGGLPGDLQRYVFLVYAPERGRGGLEHKASSALLSPRSSFTTPRGQEEFYYLVAHEYFHLWHIKRIRPRALLPYDYGQENQTRLLWCFEGTTAYYDMLLTRRAGIMPPSRYLMRLGETLTQLHATPGRRVQTLEEASFQAWVKHYRPDENSVNSAISYYLKGEVVSWLLDLTLRRATDNQRSLDDVMRLLWSRYGQGPGAKAGVPEDAIEAVVNEVAGVDLKAFFDRALRSTEELEYEVLSHVGLEVRFRVRESPGDKGGTPARSREAKPRGWLGANVRPSGTVSSVLEDSPAMAAGLYVDDEVIALDGFKVDGGSLISRCEETDPGQTVRLTLFRRDRLRTVDVRLGEKPADGAYLVKTENPTEAQKAAWAAWIGAPWDAD